MPLQNKEAIFQCLTEEDFSTLSPDQQNSFEELVLEQNQRRLNPGEKKLLDYYVKLAKERLEEFYANCKFYSIKVDLRECPSARIESKEKQGPPVQFTRGDMHSSMLNFIHFLFLTGVVPSKNFSKEELPISVHLETHNGTKQLNSREEVYKEFLRLYKLYEHYADLNDEQAILHIKMVNVQCKSLLSKLKFNNNIYVGIIGDEFADRAPLDYPNLLIFEALNKQKVPFHIESSNHGVEFLVPLMSKTHAFNDKSRLADQARSFHNLQKLVEEDPDFKETIQGIVIKNYLPNFKLADYTYNANPKLKNQTIFSIS